MIELPLFPLNTVLFPGMPLGLHIFEDRYKLMIGQCVQERRPFGVVLIRSGQEALGPSGGTTPRRLHRLRHPGGAPGTRPDEHRRHGPRTFPPAISG